MRTCKRCEGECSTYYSLEDPRVYWNTLCEGCYGVVVRTWPSFKGRYDHREATERGANN